MAELANTLDFAVATSVKGKNMKKIISLLIAITMVLFSFSACSHIPASNLLDKNRDSDGYVQFVAEFNTGLFAYTNTPNSDLEYHPDNSKLEKTFTYGSYDLKFKAQYEENKIVYNIDNPTKDKIWERKTFDDIYGLYCTSWNNYVEKAGIGSVSVSDENDIQTIELSISGLMYSVTLNPMAEVPTIVYEVIEIA